MKTMSKYRDEYCKENGIKLKDFNKYNVNNYTDFLEKKLEAMQEHVGQQLILFGVCQHRKLLEWMSDEDYFNISKDEISEILEDWQTYTTHCCTNDSSPLPRDCKDEDTPVFLL